MTRARTIADFGDGIATGDLPDITADKLDVGQIGGRRNLIINGAMQVAQRGTSSTTTTLNSYATVDRFRTLISTAFEELALTQEQSTDAPTGFGTSYKVTVSTPETALAANELLRFEQRIEGQNLQHLKKGTSDAESVTLSFWVKGSITGTYTINIFDKDNTRAIAKSYTINSANTWEYKTVTFSGDTTGALDNDNAESLTVAWNLAAGTDRTSGTLATSWEAQTNADLAVGQTDIVTTSGATWQITGVQLEVGTVATSFEHRSYGEELALCQRYFCKSFSNGVSPSNGGASALSTEDGAFNGRTSNSEGGLQVYYPVEMRVAPTLTAYGNSSGYWYANNTWHASAFGTRNRGTGRFTVSQQVVAGYSWTKGHWTADAEL